MDDTWTGRDFEQAAAKQRSSSVARELWEFVRVTKKWWLVPIVVVLLMLGALLLLAGTPVAPFIYTLF